VEKDVSLLVKDITFSINQVTMLVHPATQVISLTLHIQNDISKIVNVKSSQYIIQIKVLSCHPSFSSDKSLAV
jgi:hypothetical protein